VAGSNDLSLDKMLVTPVDLEDVNLRDRERKKRNQWLVLTHGDSWVNNFLFKYSGERPSGVKLIDLQIVREACLTTDLAYFLYMSTTAELRKKHLNRLSFPSTLIHFRMFASPFQLYPGQISLSIT
jgi:thiamine kinase-like enzyme